jgi:hypothetical protein
MGQLILSTAKSAGADWRTLVPYNAMISRGCYVMLDKISAKERVSEKLTAMAPAGDQWVVLEEKTIEKSFGWIFFYNSERFITTGNVIHRLAGNGPVFVNKITGSIDFFGSTPSLDVILETYQKNVEQKHHK